MIIEAYMDYDKKEHCLLEGVYFDKPTTKHTNPDVVLVKVKIAILYFMGRRKGNR